MLNKDQENKEIIFKYIFNKFMVIKNFTYIHYIKLLKLEN